MMNLINCTNNCIYQSSGYCTLDELIGTCVTPSPDCIYYSFGLPENGFDIPNISNCN